MRHLHTRQHLGKAVVICEQPVVVLSAARKQWLKLSRTLQKQRASTLNADKILKYTHTITRMQHMRFSVKTPLEQPEVDVYFLTPDQLHIMPVHCWTVYLTCPASFKLIQSMILQLPTEALIVDYEHSLSWKELEMGSKSALEERVHDEWRQVQNFLQAYRIDIRDLSTGDMHNVEAMDNALDTLLGVSRKFLQTANEFQRALELARPFRIGRDIRTSYDIVMLLAHRVQALSPGAFTQRFLETYNEDDTFFLYDKARKKFAVIGETFQQTFTRHVKAGRYHLAGALRMLYER
ncbi:MAG TPA: hypothetical protein VJ836_05280 [Candidatus Saccharimonadales bacterium]|nr:hypothetical protein [Candidatus Saccharimonadales bacterium]